MLKSIYVIQKNIQLFKKIYRSFAKGSDYFVEMSVCFNALSPFAVTWNLAPDKEYIVHMITLV